MALLIRPVACLRWPGRLVKVRYIGYGEGDESMHLLPLQRRLHTSKMNGRSAVWLLICVWAWVATTVVASPVRGGGRGNYPRCIGKARRVGMAHYRGWKIVGNDVSSACESEEEKEVSGLKTAR